MTEMHSELKRLCKKLDGMEIGYTAEAIETLRDVLYNLIAFVQKIAPEDKSND